MNEDVSPRPAVQEDLEQVHKIESYCFKPPWTMDAFAREFEKKGSNFWVLSDNETDEKIFGYVVFSFFDEQAHIQTFAIARAARRKGLASALIRYVINFVMRQGGSSIYLEVRKSNIAALTLYQKLGFVVVRTVKGLYPDGEDGYAMLFKMQAASEQVDEVPVADREDDEDDIPDKKNFN